ncbi:hypothetical protein ACIF70_42475 [Actinacidiphila glaucinigra]|uniref:hypothetical protein n=1 Tax=Actinacidiphila glaucinigra TaxID=235986 RepID=UPI0037C7BF8C
MAKVPPSAQALTQHSSLPSTSAAQVGWAAGRLGGWAAGRLGGWAAVCAVLIALRRNSFGFVDSGM